PGPKSSSSSSSPCRTRSRPASRRATTWRANGKAITSFAIVTTDAAPSVAQYHDRMPVVLDNAQFDDWMRGTPEQAAGIMKPYAGDIEAWEVGPEIRNVRNKPARIDGARGATVVDFAGARGVVPFEDARVPLEASIGVLGTGPGGSAPGKYPSSRAEVV